MPENKLTLFLETMPSYSNLSRLLYYQNIHGGVGNFICSPTLLLRDELRSQVFNLIIEHKGDRGLTQYIAYLEGRPYDEKYLFILALVFCSTRDRKSSEAEGAYWNNFRSKLSHDGAITPNLTDQILKLISRFCKAHCIPFFDVYQHKKRTNICGRIYSLAPFSASELNSLAYIIQFEGIDAQSDFILFKELALTSYSVLFNSATLEAFRNGGEKIDGLIKEDILPSPNYTFNQLLSDYIGKCRNEVQALVLTEEEKQAIAERLQVTRARRIQLQDFYVYFRIETKQFLIQPKNGLLDEIRVVNMPALMEDVKNINSIEFEYQGRIRRIGFNLNEAYLVTNKTGNHGWHQIEVDCDKRVYEKDVVGISNKNSGELIFSQMPFDRIDKRIKKQYSNIQSSVSLEFSGGLAFRFGSYMWFAIPDIVVHNDNAANIRMKLNAQDIPNNQGATLKEKFYRYLTNRQNVGEFPLGGIPEGGCNVLSFWSIDGAYLDSIKIECQNYLVEKESNALQVKNCDIEKGIARNMESVSSNANAFYDSLEREHLLFWMSRFKESGVTYERFRSAVHSIYRLPIDGNLTLVTKRIIEQFVGLGFIRSENCNNVTRYIINKARFISTHNGQLLYTGARSYQQIRDILSCDQGNRGLKIDHPSSIFNTIDMPSLLKYNTTDVGLIGMDNNAEVKTFVKDYFDINRRNLGDSKIQSYPLYLLRTYELCRNRIASTSYSLSTNLERFKVFNLGTLSFTKIENIRSIQPGALLQTEEYGISQRYIAGETIDRDGELAIHHYKVFPEKKDDSLYYCEYNTSIRYLGWMYDGGKQSLYIPRRINVPHQIRQALQCCVGTYTNTYFTKTQDSNSSFPRIEDGRLVLSKENATGLIEVEEFIGITAKFLKEAEQKLNITAKNITVECSRH